uniref:Aminopeptidase n=1 Tax=Timema bartmani TaxID=61472 RepID=A0A7R9I6P5_9NEOP|nr:unnamed protein product [Timema bartmani]
MLLQEKGKARSLTNISPSTIVYSAALSSLHPSPTDSCSLYLNLATVAALPVKCSRHNTPSRAHFITKLVKSATVGVDESVVIVCRREDVFASACAVARAYPLYSRKTTNNLSASTKTATVQVEFVLLSSSDDASSMAVSNGTAEGELVLGEGDIELLKNAAMAVRLAARIVDTPCNEMNVDTFVQVSLPPLVFTLSLGNLSSSHSGLFNHHRTSNREIAEHRRETLVVFIATGGVDCGPSPGSEREELNDKGFGGIYGVGKAALVPPALVVLSHLPQGATETIAWVGKGIVYDTGGLSIKGKVITTHQGQGNDNSDNSSSHQGQGNDNSDNLPSHQGQGNDNSDNSPTHQGQGNNNSDNSSSHQEQGNNNSDNSSSHQEQGNNNSDNSLSLHLLRDGPHSLF